MVSHQSVWPRRGVCHDRRATLECSRASSQGIDLRALHYHGLDGVARRWGLMGRQSSAQARAAPVRQPRASTAATAAAAIAAVAATVAHNAARRRRRGHNGLGSACLSAGRRCGRRTLWDPRARTIRAAAGCRPLLLRVRIRGRQWRWLQWLRLVVLLLAMRSSCEVPGGESGS